MPIDMVMITRRSCFYSLCVGHPRETNSAEDTIHVARCLWRGCGTSDSSSFFHWGRVQVSSTQSRQGHGSRM